MFQHLAPVTRLLIIVNVAVYGLQMLAGEPLLFNFALWPLSSGLYRNAPTFEIWQLVTYGFLHGSPMHIFFNMFAVYMFGSDIERLLGANRYVTYYFVSVIGAAVAQLVTMQVMGGPAFPTVGASGGVFGLLLAYGMAYPHRRLMLLFPPIPMPAWVFVTLYGVVELVFGITGTQQGVAHFAHLGGMAAGFILLMYWRGRRR